MNKLFTILFVCFLCSNWSFAQDCTLGTDIGDECPYFGGETGTVTVPEGVNSITVKAWGAGGGSQGASSNRRPGGGGGAYFELTYTVAPGATVVITQVGQGSPGADGGITTLTAPNGAPITVNGGKTGTNNTKGVGGAGAGGAFTPGGDGGARGNGTNDTGGGGGGSGTGASNGGSGTTMGGTAGMPGGGAGGNNGAGGNAGSNPGGGAGGTGGGTGVDVDLPGGDGQVSVCVAGIVLPVELVRFDAFAKDNQTLLEWQTASEINNEGFEIQKSNDGISWEKLEFVEGKGTSSNSNTYASIDRFPTQGSNYYRLKQMDLDGKFELSKTVVVDFNRQKEVEIFPNPAKDQLTLINGEGKATIYNSLGQAVKQFAIDGNKATIQLSELEDGQYYLRVHQEDGTIVTKQFSKAN